MKIKYIKVFYSILALSALLFTGCDNMFEAEVSTNVKSSNVLQSGYPGAVMMLRGSYQRLGNVADDISVHTAIATDDADEINGHTTSADFDLGNWVPSNPEYTIMYAGLHDARGQADRFLKDYLPNFDLTVNYGGGSVPVAVRKNSIIAYATLMRGWSTLYLGLLFNQVNYYAGPRMAPEDALRRAREDFQEINRLYALTANAPEVYFEGISIKEAANTLLAKAYLQLGVYDSAAIAASKGFTKTTKGSTGAADGTVTVFYNIAPANLSDIEGNLIYQHVGNKTVVAKSWCVTSWFIKNDSLDTRIALDTATTSGSKYTFSASNDRSLLTNYTLGYKSPFIPSKFCATTVQGKGLRILSWQDNTLTWAEAMAKSGNIAGGIAKLNEVRTGVTKDKGGSVPMRSAGSLQNAIDDIATERRIEFVAEFGDRFITCRRLGIKHDNSGAVYA
ncbi:MAG: hypothetical protein ACM3Q2_06325, partial [Syntrophothermus sp.]